MNNFNRILTENYIERWISKAKTFDIPFPGRPSFNGWKLSIQGQTPKDIIFVYERLNRFLKNNDVEFKVGTLKRLIHKNKEQARKIMTIYIPDGEDRKKFTEKIYKLIKDYKGWHNIKKPNGYEHYAGGIYWRNDRDEKGEYIPAKQVRE